MKRTSRIKKIEEILRDHPDGLRVIEISELCSVDRRTIYRDLQTMQKMGIPLWQSNGRFGIEREQYLTNLPININEAFMLLWALRLMNLHTETDNPHRQSLVKKVTNALPPELGEYLKSFQNHPLYPQSSREVKIIENITRAWADSLKLLVWYKTQGKGKPTPRVISPFILDTTPQGRLFIVALEEQNREPRIFSMQRITRAEVLEDEPFHRSHRFEVRKYWNAALEQSGKNHNQVVVLHFRPEATPSIVERQWYPNQQVDLHDDGSCIFIAEVNDWHELEKWVRSWGAQVDIIAPASFRKTLTAEKIKGAKSSRG